MESAIRTLSNNLSLTIEAAAAVLIAYGILEAAWRTVLQLLGRHGRVDKVPIRLDLGKWLTLALEFLLAADIVQTAVAPSWEEIGQLAAIAAIRTALNFFLEREIDKQEIEGKVSSAS